MSSHSEYLEEEKLAFLGEKKNNWNWACLWHIYHRYICTYVSYEYTDYITTLNVY